MENKPIKAAALAYNEILEIIKTLASVENPITFRDILAAADNVKSIQQVRDAVKKYRTDGIVAGVREGYELRVWYVGDKPKPAQSDVVVALPTVNDKPVKQKRDVPEITVTDSEVIIVSEKIKITVQL